MLLFVAVAPVGAVDNERVRVGFALVAVVSFSFSGSRIPHLSLLALPLGLTGIAS